MQYLMNGLYDGALYTLVGLAIVLARRTLGFFDLGVGGAVLAGGYLYCVLASAFGPLPSGLASIACVAGFALLIWEGLYAPAARKGSQSLSLLLVSLGVLVMIQALCGALFQHETRSVLTPWPTPSIDIGAAVLPAPYLPTMCVALFAFLAVYFWLRLTRHGKQTRAVGSDERLAIVVGCPVRRLRRTVFAVSWALAATTGVFLASDVGIDSQASFDILLKGIVVAALSGRRRLWTPLLAASAFGTLDNMAAAIVGMRWQATLAYSGAVVALVSIWSIRRQQLGPEA